MAATLLAYALKSADIDELALADDVRKALHGKSLVATIPISSLELLGDLQDVVSELIWNFDLLQSDGRICDLIAWKRQRISDQGLKVIVAISRKRARILAQQIRESRINADVFGHSEEYTPQELQSVIQLLGNCADFYRDDDECVVIFATEGFEDAP